MYDKTYRRVIDIQSREGNRRKGGYPMIFMNLFLNQDSSTYNMSMVLIYILVLTVAFIIAVIISNKLKIYKNNKVSNNASTTVNKVNESQMKVMNETAAAVDIRGIQDEQ